MLPVQTLQDRTSKLFSDLDLGGPDDLISDLRGHPRPQFKKSLYYSFEGRTSISTINQRLFEATEVVKTTVTEAVWAMEARL